MSFIRRVQAFFSCKSVDRLELEVGLSDEEGRWYRSLLPSLETRRATSAAAALFPQTFHYGSGDGQFVWPDPLMGPDIGLWFSADLASAAYNALSRGGGSSVVFSAKVSAMQVAVFPSEVALCDFARAPAQLPQARFVLLHEGYDAVYLKAEAKLTALDPHILHLQAAQNAESVMEAFPVRHHQFVLHQRTSVQPAQAALLKPPHFLCA